jgi:Rps23 Pro-64 3,4-dihydroxylase Tpa1-like proline 4-hydroxylase
MKKNFINIISCRLKNDIDHLSKQFLSGNKNTSTRFLVIDDLLPKELANKIFHSFPESNTMRFISSFREKKYTFKQLDKTPSILKDITFAIQSPKIIRLIEKITGIFNQRPDQSLYAGGLSLMKKGNFLNPHIDNSHDSERKYYRRLNLLYYVTPDWKKEFGGHLELWDNKVKKPVVIESFFNRLVIMETNSNSWHSVSPINNNGKRCCVSNYYFSDQSPSGKDYYHVTSFGARPEQKFLRILCSVDNFLRKNLRLVFKKGVGQVDVYK